ncbi:MAG TPA: hypothetical protein VFC94_05630, partial [Bacteroidaceae bacterium]|nr:hypothetical protein [Bacteroidaceae bacterium]
MKPSNLKFFIICLFALTAYSAYSQINDTIKSELNAIIILNSDSKRDINKYKKGVLKGNLNSMNSLGIELISG